MVLQANQFWMMLIWSNNTYWNISKEHCCCRTKRIPKMSRDIRGMQSSLPARVRMYPVRTSKNATLCSTSNIHTWQQNIPVVAENKWNPMFTWEVSYNSASSSICAFEAAFSVSCRTNVLSDSTSLVPVASKFANIKQVQLSISKALDSCSHS